MYLHPWTCLRAPPCTALCMLCEGLMEVDRLGSRDPPICSGRSSYCRVTSEPRRKNAKKKRRRRRRINSFKKKGKKKKREGEKKKEKTGTLCSNGSYAKKQLTKNRQSREEKWGKHKMVWSQADKCTREKFTWLQSSSWRLSQKFMHVYSFSFLFLEEYFAVSFYWKKMSYFHSPSTVERTPLSSLQTPTSSSLTVLKNASVCVCVCVCVCIGG